MDLTIPSICADCSVEEVWTRFLLPNQPFIMKDGCKEWRAWGEFRLPDGKLHSEAFLSEFGDATVPVVVRSAGYDDETRESRKLRKVNFGPSDGVVYVKDWHIVRDYPGSGLYATPSSFCDDWLNRWWDHVSSTRETKDDFRFCYLGTKGSSTWLHHDVLCSNSWSGNVVGRKHWLLFPPSETSKLMDVSRHQLISDARPDVADESDETEPWRARSSPLDCTKFPYVSSAMRMSFVQWPGDIVFVPVGWHHQVHNIDDVVLSINHNWFNASTLTHVWAFLNAELAAVQAKIADCRTKGVGEEDHEWDELCGVVMKANCGMSLAEFFTLLLIKYDEYQRGADNVFSAFSIQQIIGLFRDAQRRKLIPAEVNERVLSVLCHDSGVRSTNIPDAWAQYIIT